MRQNGAGETSPELAAAAIWAYACMIALYLPPFGATATPGACGGSKLRPAALSATLAALNVATNGESSARSRSQRRSGTPESRADSKARP